MNMDVDSSALDLSADDEADLRMRARAHADRIRVRSAAADCETKQCKPKDASRGWNVGGVMWMIVHSLRELCSEWMIVQVSDFKRG